MAASSQGSPRLAPNARGPVFYLYLGRIVRSLTQSYLAVLVPLYLLQRGASPTTVGLLVACWSGGAALLAVLAGFVADRFGRKLVLAIFGAFTAVGAVAFALDAPFWILAFAGALGTIGRGGSPASGGAFGPYFSAEQALVAELSEGHHRTTAFARLGSIGSFAGAFGFLVASAHIAPHDIFYATSVAGVVLALIALPIPERRAPPQERRAVRLSRDSLKILVRLAITNATNGLAVGFLGSMLVLFLHLRYGATQAQIGMLYFVIALAVSLNFLVVAGIVRRIGGAVRTVVALRTASCALLALMPFMPTFALCGVVYLLRMMLNAVTISVRQSYVMGVVAPQERSRVSSLSNLPSQVSSMVAPAVAGIIIEHLWIGTMLEAAATLQLLNAALYQYFFASLKPPEEK